MTDAACRIVKADRGDAGLRLDLVLRRHLTDVRAATRTRVQTWIESGRVTVNGKAVHRVAVRAALGDVVSIEATLVSMTTDLVGNRVPETDPVTGDPVAVPGNEVPDAVYVTATGEVDFAFATGTGSATRDALANASTFACFRIGSFAGRCHAPRGQGRALRTRER